MSTNEALEKDVAQLKEGSVTSEAMQSLQDNVRHLQAHNAALQHSISCKYVIPCLAMSIKLKCLGCMSKMVCFLIRAAFVMHMYINVVIVLQSLCGLICFSQPGQS